MNGYGVEFIANDLSMKGFKLEEYFFISAKPKFYSEKKIE